MLRHQDAARFSKGSSRWIRTCIISCSERNGDARLQAFGHSSWTQLAFEMF